MQHAIKMVCCGHLGMRALEMSKGHFILECYWWEKWWPEVFLSNECDHFFKSKFHDMECKVAVKKDGKYILAMNNSTGISNAILLKYIKLSVGIPENLNCSVTTIIHKGSQSINCEIIFPFFYHIRNRTKPTPFIQISIISPLLSYHIHIFVVPWNKGSVLVAIFATDLFSSSWYSHSPWVSPVR